MTKVIRKNVICNKCGKESEQMIVHSVNFFLGNKKDNDALINQKQKCPHCGFEADYIDVKIPLKRMHLEIITEKFIKESNKYSIFQIPDELYINYFNEIENLQYQSILETDDRFVTFGRIDFLIKEVDQRLNDKKLNDEDPKWGQKWDNRMGAFWDLHGVIKGDWYFVHGHVPEGQNFRELFEKNEQYYKDGVICKEEFEVILNMINKIRKFIENKNNKSIDTEDKKGMEEKNMDLFNKKYNIDEEDNVPQFVYGIPDEMRKQWEDIDKKIDSKCIFEAFEGGYGGPSIYYYINEYNNDYYFRFGYTEDGRFVQNISQDQNLHSMKQNSFHYVSFIEELSKVIKDWKNKYANNDIMDGTQWSIKDEKNKIDIYGSNDFPSNYMDLKKLLVKYFNVEMFVKDYMKYEIDPEDNIPYEVYGIADFNLNQGIKKDESESKFNGKKCPHCGSTNLLKYLYGEPTYDYDREKYILGGCVITGNDPEFKCVDCGKDIYKEKSLFSLDNILGEKYDIDPKNNNPQRVYGVPNSMKQNNDVTAYTKEFIKVSIVGKESVYTFLLDKVQSPSSTTRFDSNIIFVSGPLDKNNIGDVSAKIPVFEFNNYGNKIVEITKNWDIEINSNQVNSTSFNIDWKLEYKINGKENNFNGKNFVPKNWNVFIDFISELELIFKQLKKAEIKRSELLNNVHNNSNELPNKDAFPPVSPSTKKKITKSDWKTKDMPTEKVEFELEKLLSDEDIKVLSFGHKPKEMEDKWFWYVENNILNIHRSWTGICIYKVELNTSGKLKAIVNRNQEEYKITDINEDIKNLNDLLSYWTSEKYQKYQDEEPAQFVVIDPKTGEEM